MVKITKNKPVKIKKLKIKKPVKINTTLIKCFY